MITSVLTAVGYEVGHLVDPGLRQGGQFARFQPPIALNSLSRLKKSPGPFCGGKGTQARAKCRSVAVKPLSLLQKQGYARIELACAQPAFFLLTRRRLHEAAVESNVGVAR